MTKVNLTLFIFWNVDKFFTYEKQENCFVVFSQDKKAILTEENDKIIIKTKDTEYFEIFFDLKTDYNKIKNILSSKYEFLRPMITYGSGIRILKQSKLETIIGFIISANNNIGRITNSMKIFTKIWVGRKIEDYYAFSNNWKVKPMQWKGGFFFYAGLGYRSKQIVKTISQLKTLI